MPIEDYITIKQYSQNYFNSPIGFWTQKKPDVWAKQYLNVSFEAAVFQACTEAIQQYNQLPIIKRLWRYWLVPIGRLKTYHAMLRLRQVIHDVGDNPTPVSLARLNQAFITARLERDVFFWMYYSIRWLIGASNPWITQGLPRMNDKNETLLPNATLSAIQQVLEKTRRELAEYGTRRGKESLLVGELLRQKAECATSLGLISYEACEQARLRIRLRQDFQSLTNLDLPRILFEDKLTYYRALEEEINACQSILANDLNNQPDSLVILAKLQSLLTLIEEGFYLNQYVYSTNRLPGNQSLGYVWEIYNRLPQQLLEFVQTLSKDTPDWLNPWVTQVEALANHVQCLIELSKEYESCFATYKQLAKKVHKLKQQPIPDAWPAITEMLLLLEEKRQAAYYAYENKPAFWGQLEQFKNKLQLFSDNEGLELANEQKKLESNNTLSYIDSLYHQSTTVASGVYRYVFPSIAADNPLLPQMEKEDKASRRIQEAHVILSQLWQTTSHYGFSPDDYERLRQQWQELEQQLIQLRQQYEAVNHLMMTWRSGNEILSLEQSMGALMSFRTAFEEKQSLYQVDFEQSHLVLLDAQKNPMVAQDLETLAIINDGFLTKRQLTQQYKKLSLKCHPDKHVYDTLPPCDGLYLDYMTEKADIFNYCVRVCPDKAVYVFVTTTNNLFYVNAKLHQIEHVTSFDTVFLATFGLDQTKNLPVSLTPEQIESIAEHTQHNHRTRFWQMHTQALQVAFQRLSVDEQGLDVELWEQANQQALKKEQSKIIQELREQQQTKTMALQELVLNQEKSKVKFSQEISDLKEKNSIKIAEAVAKIKEENATELLNLKQSNDDVMKQLNDLNAAVQKILANPNSSMSSENVSSIETEQNYSTGAPGFFG